MPKLIIVFNCGRDHAKYGKNFFQDGWKHWLICLDFWRFEFILATGYCADHWVNTFNRGVNTRDQGWM